MSISLLYYEKKLWMNGFNILAGADEVGRGCLAGPVVCGAVAFDKRLLNSIFNIPDSVCINDSKKLSDKQRRISAKWIKENSLGWGVGIGTVSQIIRYGIVPATNSGFRRAVSNLEQMSQTRVEYLLIDAFYIPYTRGLRQPTKKTKKGVKYTKLANFDPKDGRQLAIVNGDEKSFLIGAASIIAKVYRDDLMKKLTKGNYLKYDWASNKGYGTRNHINVIKKYGITKHHRKTFIHFLSPDSKH